MLYLICYDIVSSKRRNRAAIILLDFGSRVQKSTFECELKTEARLRELIRRVRPHLDPRTDTLRIYRLCATCVSERQLLGLDKAPPPLPPTLIL
jgi:CRISPR-associated protein Cas2